MQIKLRGTKGSGKTTTPYDPTKHKSYILMFKNTTTPPMYVPPSATFQYRRHGWRTEKEFIKYQLNKAKKAGIEVKAGIFIEKPLCQWCRCSIPHEWLEGDYTLIICDKKECLDKEIAFQEMRNPTPATMQTTDNITPDIIEKPAAPVVEETVTPNIFDTPKS